MIMGSFSRSFELKELLDITDTVIKLSQSYYAHDMLFPAV